MVRGQRFTLIASILVVAACSGGDSAEISTPTTAAEVVDAGPSATTPTAGVVSPTTAPPRPRTVTIAAASESLGIDLVLSSDAGTAADPFGDSAVCSGQYDLVGAYVVGVGEGSGAVVRWASIATVERVSGPGIYAADLRVEPAIGSPVDAVGSLTLDDGLASGTFLTFTADGVAIDGSFECDDAGAVVTSDGGLIEVVSLLQRGRAERIVSVVSDDPTSAQCSLGGDGSAMSVSVEGSPGSTTSFELRETGSGTVNVRLGVGTAMYEFDDVEFVRLGEQVAATFSGSSGEVVVDGAFSCWAS